MNKAYEFITKIADIACIFLSISIFLPRKLTNMGGTPFISLNSPSYNLIEAAVAKKENIHK